jgi:Fe-S oxidoreductase
MEKRIITVGPTGITTGAEAVAAVCPFCATMFRDGLMDKGSGILAKDIVEIIDEAAS